MPEQDPSRDRAAAASWPRRREVSALVEVALVEAALEQVAEAEEAAREQEAGILGSCRDSSGSAAIQEGASGLQQESAGVAVLKQAGEARREIPEDGQPCALDSGPLAAK